MLYSTAERKPFTSLSEFLCLRHNVVVPERNGYAKEETVSATAARSGEPIEFDSQTAEFNVDHSMKNSERSNKDSEQSTFDSVLTKLDVHTSKKASWTSTKDPQRSTFNSQHCEFDSHRPDLNAHACEPLSQPGPRVKLGKSGTAEENQNAELALDAGLR